MGLRRNLVLGGCIGCFAIAGADAAAQSVTRERNVSVTGPGGRTLERNYSATRGPNGVDRQLSVSRPGGTLERSIHASAAPAFRGGHGPGPGYRPGPWFGPPPPRGGGGPSPLLSFGLGALTGAAVAAPIARMTAPAPVVVAGPPVVVVDQPAVIAAPPTVIVEQPAVVAAAPVDPLDPVALAAQRLQSVHGGTRREAAESLGLLGDPRGIPPLVDALKNDWNTSVRIASAMSIGQIGGPEAEGVLGRAVVYEKKDSVRDAAAQALNVARAKAAALAAQARPTETVIESRVEPLPRTASAPRRPVPKPPTPGPARPSAWKAQGAAEPDPILLEGPADEEVAPSRDRTPPPPPSAIPG